VQFEVAAVIDLGPLELEVNIDQGLGFGLAFLEILGVAHLTATSDGCAAKLGTDGALAGGVIVGLLASPDDVGDPVSVSVAGNEDVVADAVVVKRLEGAVLVGNVSIPGVVVVGVGVIRILVDVGEDWVALVKDPGWSIRTGNLTHLTTDDSPRSSPLVGFDEVAVEPVLLSGSHHRAAGIVRDGVYEISIGVDIGDGTVILTGIKHQQVNKGTDLEVSPDTETIVHINLAIF
jgi:hypothetical protein